MTVAINKTRCQYLSLSINHFFPGKGLKISNGDDPFPFDPHGCVPGSSAGTIDELYILYEQCRCNLQRFALYKIPGNPVSKAVTTTAQGNDRSVILCIPVNNINKTDPSAGM